MNTSSQTQPGQRWSRGAKVAAFAYVLLVCATVALVSVRPESSRSIRMLRSAVGAANPPEGAGSTQVSAPASGSRQQQSLEQQGRSKTSTQSAGSKNRRGILIVGEGEQLATAYVNLRVLREELQCSLPVEVVYYGEEEAPPPHVLSLLQSLPDLAVVDASKTHVPGQDMATAGNNTPALRPPRKHMGFMTKIFALAYVTTFSEVLLLDCDNLVLVNPEELFDIPQYKRHGNLFWPDWWHPYGTMLAVKPQLYQGLGLPVPWQSNPTGFRCTESGQVLLDRRRHKDVLDVLWWLTTQEQLTKLIHGDKYPVVGQRCATTGGTQDLYRVAFHMVNKSAEYQQVDPPARSAAGVGGSNQLTFQGMVQLHPTDGRPAFHHRTGPTKYIPHHASNPDAARVQYFTSGLQHHQAYRVVGRWWWASWEVDSNAWGNRNCSYSYTPSHPQARYDVPELWCKGDGDPLRLPLYSLAKFGQSQRMLDRAHQLMVEYMKSQDGASSATAAAR